MSNTSNHRVQKTLIEVKDYLTHILPELQISAIEELPSAQQHVCILHFPPKQVISCNGHESPKQSLECKDENMTTSQTLQRLKRAIHEGNGRLIVRIWKGGSRWWNLNRHDAESFLHVARAEIAGYRVATEALDSYNYTCQQFESNHICDEMNQRFLRGKHLKKTEVKVPEVLHCFIPQKDNEDGILPYAIFSYIGKDSLNFKNNINDNENKATNWTYTDRFIRDMVKIRYEFGFDEPHPRHGRVCVDLALDYAIHVLDSIVLPLHFVFYRSYFGCTTKNPLMISSKEDTMSLQWEGHTVNSDFKHTSETLACTYIDMVRLYSDTLVKIVNQIQSNQQTRNDGYLTILAQVLQNCLESLLVEAKTLQTSKGEKHFMPAVLCHMDLQPQNMIFRQYSEGLEEIDSIPNITHVLDWEEACYCDPRFELLLICRKVTANRYQADSIWQYYTEKMNGMLNFQHDVIQLGRIQPWLRLEGVHSIITLTLQELNMQGGGRTPWEKKVEIRKKVRNEFCRLIDLGWSFCKHATIAIDESVY